MRTRQFEIPQELIVPFFHGAEQAELEVELIEVNEDDELVAEITYGERERKEVMNLIELIDDFHNEDEEEAE